MAYQTSWIDGLPNPWDFGYRDKFLLHLKKVDLFHYDRTSIEGYYTLINELKDELELTGKFDFLKNNNLDLRTITVTGMQEHVTYELRLFVLVDMPDNIRTLYTLAFKE